MANIKSSKKRVLIAERNRLRNVAFKTSIKTAVKKVLELAKAEDKDALNAALSKAYQLCDKAVSKGVLHKNTAARKKSRLTKAVNKLQAAKQFDYLFLKSRNFYLKSFDFLVSKGLRILLKSVKINI